MYVFDHVVGPNVNQLEMYDTLVKPLVQKVFEGFHCTVMAHGQTGSGKSYTMGMHKVNFYVFTTPFFVI